LHRGGAAGYKEKNPTLLEEAGVKCRGVEDILKEESMNSWG